MAVGASSYYDLPYDELYEADCIEIALDHGVSQPCDELEHPDELAVFEGHFINFRRPSDVEPQLVEVRLPVRLTLYRSWLNGVPDFEMAPSPDLGTAALSVGRFEGGRYTCRIAISDSEESLTQKLFMALLIAGVTGKREVVLSLSGRRDYSPPEPSEVEAPSGDVDEPTGFVASYAWSACGVEHEEFGEALDAQEHEPPIAHFEKVLLRVEVDPRKLANAVTTKSVEPPT